MATTKQLIATKYGSFFARFTTQPGGLRVTVPAFPDVMTEARSLGEAKKYAKEVIELQCLAALDDHRLVIDDARRAYGKLARPGSVRVVA